MQREDQLKFCKVCTKQKFDINSGIVCGLTNEPAAFEESCESFQVDPKLKAQNDLRAIEKETVDKIAGKGKRLMNFLVDYLFTAAISGIVLIYLIPRSWMLEQETDFVLYFILILIHVMYYTILEYLTGRTLAKFLTKTKVLRDNGLKADFETILLRTVCRYIPFEPFSFLGSAGRGWHDKLSKTIVVNS